MQNSRFFEKDKKVQERWFRMKFHQKFGIKIQTFLFKRLHRKLEKQFVVADKAISEAINTTVTQHRKTNEELFPETKHFYNIGLYFLLAERDIQALKADALSHPNLTKRNMALRTLLLTIFEWDMGKVTGKKMSNIYNVTELSDSSKQSLVTSLKAVRKAREKIVKKFAETRHNSIAHREADAFRQYEIISELNIRNYSTELSEYYSAADQLLSAMTATLKEIGSMAGLMNQVIYSAKRA